MKISKSLFFLVAILSLQGCMVTKVVTVPMRVTGAIISVVPVVGSPIDSIIDSASDAIDALPI